MSASPDVIAAIQGLLPPLLATLGRVEWVQRHLYPPLAERLAAALAPGSDAIARPLRALETLAWPERLHFIRDRLLDGGQ